MFLAIWYVARHSQLTSYRLHFLKKRRAVIEDLCIGLGIPVIEMALRELNPLSGSRYLS